MIKKASFEDIPVIMHMASLAFPDTYKDILSQDQIEYMMQMMYSEKSIRKQMEDEEHEYYIYYDENSETPLGYISFSNDYLSIYHIHKIYVLPGYHGQGIGRKMFEFVIEIMRSRSATRVELNVNRFNTALAFYKRMGMRVQSEGDFPIGKGYFMNDYIMELDLK